MRNLDRRSAIFIFVKILLILNRSTVLFDRLFVSRYTVIFISFHSDLFILYHIVQVFKSKFDGWDDMIAVDFTRTVESIRKTGADLMSWAKKETAKVIHQWTLVGMKLIKLMESGPSWTLSFYFFLRCPRWTSAPSSDYFKLMTQT